MMVLRKLAVALLSAGVMLPGLGHALAVKELQTKSALGEPFQAEVELIELGDLNADEIKVSLASQEDFERMGIDRVYFLSDLKFNVVVNQGGRSYIQIISSKPVVEPYLDFVVRIAWPGNARLQEVTALLDPPVISDSVTPEVNTAVSGTPDAQPVEPEISDDQLVPVAPIEPAVTSEPATPPQAVASESKPEPEQAPAPAAEPAPQPAPVPTPAPQPAPVAADGYRVQPGDTMGRIAEQFRSGDVTVTQSMVAIQRVNPQAFINNNINQLKRGQVLRIPSESQMREISAQEALASVREQTDAWRAATTAPADKSTLEGQQLNATAKVEAPAPAPAPEGKPEMKLLGADSSKKGAAAAGKEQGAVVKPEDARKLGEIKSLTEAAQANKKKLSGKIESLDAQIAANDKKMELQNTKLAELEAQLKQQQAKKSQSASSATPAVPAAPEGAKPADAKAPEVSAPSADTAVPAPSAGAEAPAKPKSKAKPKAKPAVTPPAEEESLTPVIAAGAAGLLAAVLGGWWWSQRRRREQSEDAAALAELESDTGGADDIFSGGQVDAAQADTWQDSDWLGEASAEVSPPAADRVLADPLDEAEQYIAYERFPQAAALLKKALGSSPDRADLRMKLLEVQARLGDWNGFAEQEAWFENAGDLQAIARAEELKAGMGAAGAASAASDDLDFGSFASAPAAKSAASDELPSLEDLEMDFNATVSASSPALDTVKDSDLAGDSGLSLDLNDFESEFGATAKTSASDDLSFELDDSAFDSKPAAAPAAADKGLDFSLDEPELAGSSSAGASLGELEDFENLPDLAPPQESKPAARAEDDGLSFSLDDLEFSDEPAKPAAAEEFSLETELETQSADDLGMEELSFESEPQAEQVESASDDLGIDFDSTLKADEPLVAAEEPAPVAEPAPQPVEAASAPADLGMDDEFDFLADTDENATKLDLARAYIDMGDMEGARDILQEVLSEGNSSQKDEAKGLLAQVG